MPYNREWAAKIVQIFWNSCTRAQQIDSCILQVLNARSLRLYIVSDLHRVLAGSLAGKADKRIWPLYKRVCKHTPLDKAQLYKLIEWCSWDLVMDVCQIEFPFEVDVDKKPRQSTGA